MVDFKNHTKILFLGRQQNVENIMNICDIGVLATFTEGISNSLLEFMSLSKPVIATGNGGTIELIENMVNGMLIEAKQPELLKNNIERLLDDKICRIKMGHEALKKVQNLFTIDRMIEDFLNIYKAK